MKISQPDWILRQTCGMNIINLCSEDLLGVDYLYNRSGILIWHILEDRLFLSEGFCRLMGVNKSRIVNLELLYWMDPECEMKKYLSKILDQVCSSENADTSFKTMIPGIQKEIYGNVQLFDKEEIGILDLMLICWE